MVPLYTNECRFCFRQLFLPVYYKGYFVPLPDAPAVDCPTTPKAGGGDAGGAGTTPKPTAAQSWDAPARIQLNKNKATNPVRAGMQPQKNPNEVEVFGAAPSPTQSPQSSVEDLGEKQPPNINIEIHNIFSFGTENANNLPKNGTREV